MERHPAATAYHLRAWSEVARRSYQIEAAFLLARDVPGGPCRGVLPLFSVGSVCRHVTNGLFGAYADVLADQPRHRDELLAAAAGLSRDARARYLLLKCLDRGAVPKLPGLERHDPWVIATLPLQGGEEGMWRGFRDKIRNCIRKGQRSGLTASFGAAELPRFYGVLSTNMHRKGTPTYGYGFIQELHAALGPRCDVVTIRSGERTVAGALLMYHRKRVYVPFASSLPDALPTCPNNLMYWEIIRRGLEHGMEVLDFGRSQRGSGPLKFKLGWGATTEAQPCFTLAARSRAPRFDTQAPWVTWFSRQWQRLPIGVAEALGPAICRQIAGII